MFRATCDKRVTTSAARQPTTSKPDHLEMPAGKPDVHPHQTAPTLSTAPPPARQRLIATHHDSPSIHTPTLRDRPCHSTPHTRDSRICRPQHRSRVRTMAHQHAHETSPCQPATATNTESTVADDCLPDTPTTD
jgi:hypothetical protein